MIKVVQIPKEEAKQAEVGKWLYEGYRTLGMLLDLEGFLLAWANDSTKMVVDVDADNKITSGALLVIGKKWSDDDPSATILEQRGDRSVIIPYCINIATAFGVRHMYFEALEGEPGVLERVHKVVL